MKKARFCAGILVFTVFFVPVAGADTLQEQLDAKRAAFAEQADPQLQADFQTGIDLVAASGVLQTAKRVGDMAPEFSLIDAAGMRVTLQDKLKYGPVILIWYRGEWCPYCNIQLQEYHKWTRAFERAGATLIAISPQTHEYTISTQQKNQLGFHVVSDPNHEVAERYGITYRLPTVVQKHFEGRIDLDKHSGEGSRRLPLTATFVIDKDGMITYAFVDPDYKKRAEPAIVLDEVKKLR